MHALQFNITLNDENFFFQIWAYSLLFCRYKSLYKFYCFLFHLCPALIADNVAKLLGKKPK